MKAKLTKVEWNAGGIHIEVTFSPTEEETFAEFVRHNVFDSTTFTRANVEDWVDKLAVESKAQMSKAEAAQAWVGYEKVV